MTNKQTPSERERFMATIKRMWLDLGRSEASWDAVHDWDYYFVICERKAEGAPQAFEDALRCE